MANHFQGLNKLTITRRRWLGILCGMLAGVPSALLAADTVVYEPAGKFPQLPAEYSLGRCSAVAANRKGEIYLFHRGKHPIICVTPEGKYLRSWGDDYITMPHGLRVDRHENVWVTDLSRHRVLKFDPAGKLLLALGTGQRGTGTDQFDQPADVAFGPDDSVYVADGYGNSRVIQFSAAGRYLHAWGTRGQKPGEFHLPHSILVDSQKRLLVGDRENNRIQIFDFEGKLLDHWEGFAPYGLAMDQAGRIFVADARAQQILQLDGAGKVVQRWGRKGTAPGEFDLPHMLAFDATDNLYIAEVAGARFQKFVKK